MARPFGTLKYDNLEELQAGIDKYFNQCDGELFLDGEGQPMTDKHGNAIYKKLPQPYTMSGLALALNVDRVTLLRYGTEGYSENADYCLTIQRAREKVQNYAESRLFDKDGVNGAKFSLINNHKAGGWSDRQEIDMNVAPITFVDDIGI